MKKIIQPKGLQDPRPRFSTAILTDSSKLLFISGQTASDGNGNVVGVGDIEAQARQVFEKLKTIVAEAGGSLDDIVKTTVYITDAKYREAQRKVRSQYMTVDPPTSTLIIVKGLAREEFLIEVEAIAVLN
ncbi:MAG: RidA family protein [Deltaproteobacteria bacterium]|nr:RidA family protein [Deltaproteobacteria bacterium]